MKDHSLLMVAPLMRLSFSFKTLNLLVVEDCLLALTQLLLGLTSFHFHLAESDEEKPCIWRFTVAANNFGSLAFFFDSFIKNHS